MMVINVWQVQVIMAIMTEIESVALLIGLITSAVVNLLILFYGIYKRLWTPKRIFLVQIFCFIPAMIGAFVSSIQAGRYVVIPVEIFIIVIALLVGIAGYGHAKREPWKSRLRIADNLNHKNRNDGDDLAS